MKIIELRRHSDRDNSSPHLNQRGVEKARKVGELLGDFNLIFSSDAPRAIETAVAMGYAVNQVMEEISRTPKEIQMSWGMNFLDYYKTVKQDDKTADYANQMSLFIKDIAKLLSENESILIISHGGLIEITVIGCFPQINYEKWGESLDTCEGVRIFIKNNEFEKIDLLRVLS